MTNKITLTGKNQLFLCHNTFGIYSKKFQFQSIQDKVNSLVVYLCEHSVLWQAFVMKVVAQKMKTKEIQKWST